MRKLSILSLFFWGLAWIAPPLYAERYITLQPIPQASNKSLDFDQLLPLISPSKEAYLDRTFPKAERTLPFLPAPFQAADFGLTEIPLLNVSLDDMELSVYSDLIDKLQRDDDFTAENSVLKIQRKFLIGDLMAAVAIHAGQDWAYEGRLIEGRRYLANLINRYPDSPYTVRASYHLALILLEQAKEHGDYDDFFDLAQRQLAYWGDSPEWGGAFRSAIMEAYYRRGLMGRTESFLWQQAFKITMEQIPRDVSLRYADSLFWQDKYEDVVQWYGRIAEILEPPDSEAAQISRLYYAESLFQTGRCDEAMSQFNFFIDTYTGQRKFPEIRLREIECDVLKTKDYAKAIAALERLILKPSSPQTDWRRMTGLTAELMSLRLATISGSTSHRDALTSKLQKRLQTAIPDWFRDEILYTLAIAQWSNGQRAEALDSLLTLSQSEAIRRNHSPWIPLMTQAVSLFLSEEGPRYVRGRHEFDYLKLVHFFDGFIQNAPRKYDILLWAARAYLRKDLPFSAVRLLQKVYFQDEITPEIANLYALELVQAYSDIGEFDLMKSAFQLVQSDGLFPEDLQHYYLMKADIDRSEGHFDRCSDDFNEVFKMPITASKLLDFSLQGAICARKGKKFEDAENFITHFGEVDAILAERLKNPQATSDVRGDILMQGLFEKINILAAKEDFENAIRTFERVTKVLPDVKPPLDTLFLVVDAYRKNKGSDFALQMWQTYQGDYGELPPGFANLYAETLDLFARADLISN